MRWLIVEDSLRNRRGHWFEYLGTFYRELPRFGDEVTILADGRAEPFICEQLRAQPVLPPGIFLRMSDSAGPLRRYLRVPWHAFVTQRAVSRWLRQHSAPDLIFVPTVIVHHLLGWTWLIKRRLRRTPTRVLLFFPNTPIRFDEATREPLWDAAPTARLFCRLIRSLAPEVARGQVILGAETHAMRDALTQLSGVEFTYLPHPVAASPSPPQPSAVQADGPFITLGSYGSARHEKGAEILFAAVQRYCTQFPDTRIRFALQCVDSFTTEWRKLEGNDKVTLITRYFREGEYLHQVRSTQAMLLPYRISSYALRVSRVVIEALVEGLPVVATAGTTLAQQVEEFGAGTLCEDGNVESLVRAMRALEENFPKLCALAADRVSTARAHFSVNTFRSILVDVTDTPRRGTEESR